MKYSDVERRKLLNIGLQFFAEENKDTEGEDKTDPDDKSGDESKKDKTFTQAEINVMMSKEKKQARTALLKELGLEGDSTDIKTLISTFKTDQDSKKTDLQKKDDEIKRLGTEKEEGNKKTSYLEAKFAAIEAGANTEYVEDVLAIALSKVTETKDLKAVLEEMKKKYTTFFTAGDNKRNGTGNSLNDKNKSDGKVEGLGERLGKKNATVTKSTYFKNY